MRSISHTSLSQEGARDPSSHCAIQLRSEFVACSGELTRIARRVQPQVLHTHFLSMAPLLHRVAESLSVPFTIRTHSVDVLGAPPQQLRLLSDYINDPLCLGIIAFPFLKPRLIDAGANPEKVHVSFPVVDFDRFYNREPNSIGVINVGAPHPKKNMRGYLEMATKVPDVPFSLYAMGKGIAGLRALNASLGQPADIPDPVPHTNMPQIYKQHNWLLYTASDVIGTVGWPIDDRRGASCGRGSVHRGNTRRPE